MGDVLTRPPLVAGLLAAGRRGRLVDGVLLAAVVVSATLWLADVRSPARTVATVLSLCVAPGWGLLRAAGARMSMLNLVVAIAISCALVMLTGLLLVTRLGWDWAAGVNVLNLVASVSLTVAIARDRTR